MISRRTDQFREQFRALPTDVQELARKAYELWQDNPAHPSLHFKRVYARQPIYSIRIGRGWRVLDLRESNTIYWFWIGSHAEYDQLLRQL